MSNTMGSFVRLLDTTSVDKYAYTTPHVWSLLPTSPFWQSGAAAARSGSYGWLADRMRMLEDLRDVNPVWVFVETARPFLSEPGSLTIAPEEIEGAVWSAIIHEARGIAYFQHNNGRPMRHVLDRGVRQPLRDKLAALHAKIRSLAPVINTQSYRYDFRSGTDTMLKSRNGYAYVFAGIGLGQSSGEKTFTLPPGVGGGTVTVVGEDRTLPVVDGRFTDVFDYEYTHHVYGAPLGPAARSAQPSAVRRDSVAGP